MNKTVLITGASGGIGSAAAIAFAREGYAVALHYYKSEEKCAATAEQIRQAGGYALMIKADVSDEAQVRSMTERVFTEFGRIDVLVNNAGIALQKLFTETNDEDWERIFAVNVKGAYYCCRHVLPNMISNKRGKIINVSSVWGICGAACETAYSASKAALIGFTKALAKEMGPSGIQVNCVAPGVIRTEMNAGLDDAAIAELRQETPLGRLGEPEEIAQCILYLASGQADFMTGQVISPNGGFLI